MNKLPDDLLQYLRYNKLADAQKKLIRELAADNAREPRTAAEYSERYARRSMRIRGITA